MENQNPDNLCKHRTKRKRRPESHIKIQTIKQTIYGNKASQGHTKKDLIHSDYPLKNE